MVRIGWKAGAEQYQPTELLSYAVAADKAGFDLLDVSDHFHPWSEAGACGFSWTWLGAVAVQTSKLALGTGVTCPILRYHPSIIAQAAATLDAMAPGRAWLGLGTGEALNEYAAMGEWPGYTERQARLTEAIDLIRALWSGQEVSHHGHYYQTRKAKLYTPPTRSIPIILSTLVPQSAAYAGKHGDGLITTGGKPPELYQQIIKNFEMGAREAGKDPTRMPRMVELEVAYTDQVDEAIQEHLKYWASTHIPALFDQKIYNPTMAQENGEVVGPDSVKKAGCFSSDPEKHLQFFQQYVDLGFDTLICHFAGPDMPGFIERYARDVLPRVRTLKSRQAVRSA
jgi:coenzyme F420-dependent glucose-6-phosphate dehydrogenase